MRPIAEIDCGLWPTPVADDAPDREKGKVNSRGEPKLSGQVKALWPTPKAADGRGNVYEATENRRSELRKAAAQALWPTPTTLASAKNGNNEAGNSAGLVAIRNHAMAMWPTPTANDWKGSGPTTIRSDGQDRTFDRMDYATERGHAHLGSSEPTEKPGALNPQFVCWLTGYPPAWESCAPSATRSSRKSAPKSSAPISIDPLS
jgi:hypothetical protein